MSPYDATMGWFWCEHELDLKFLKEKKIYQYFEGFKYLLNSNPDKPQMHASPILWNNLTYNNLTYRYIWIGNALHSEFEYTNPVYMYLIPFYHSPAHCFDWKKDIKLLI